MFDRPNSAAFDLELYQYSVLNVFLNAELDRTTYVQCPEGYEKELGQLLELKRALYGLRDAPRLWHKHLTSTLEKLGLRQVPEVPCLFSNDQPIVFFLVDDIVVAVASKKKDAYHRFDQQLRATYNVRFLGELKWFLGIGVIRDRSQKKIWLMQDSYIDKVAAKYNIAQRSTTYPAVPPVDGNIGSSTEEPDEKRTKLSGTGWITGLHIIIHSTRCCANTLRIITKSTKSGQKHISAVYHAWKYLIGQKRPAIGAQGGCAEGHTVYMSTDPEITNADMERLFYGASDAAFADDLPTRHSS
jgi:hypothetical protein